MVRVEEVKMAVLIPDMDLPKNCVSCPFCVINIGTYCNLLEADINRNLAKTERLRSCPLQDVIVIGEEIKWQRRKSDS